MVDPLFTTTHQALQGGCAWRVTLFASVGDVMIVDNVIPFDETQRLNQRMRVRAKGVVVNNAVITLRPDVDVRIDNLPLDLTLSELHELTFGVFTAIVDFAEREGLLR